MEMRSRFFGIHYIILYLYLVLNLEERARCTGLCSGSVFSRKISNYFILQLCKGYAIDTLTKPLFIRGVSPNAAAQEKMKGNCTIKKKAQIIKIAM